MAFEALLGLSNPVLSITILSSAILISAFLYLFKRPSLPSNAPPLVAEAWPIIGSMQFFSQRWDFFKRQMAHSPTGNFSFYAGDKIVVGMSGDESRRIFFEHKHLSLTQGYGALLGGSPSVNDTNAINTAADDKLEEGEFVNYFAKRLVAMLKGPLLAKGLPQLLEDMRTSIDRLATQETKVTDPFDSIYRVVFQMTMRTVACVEIAGDDALRERCLKLFEEIEGTATPMSIMYNWMPVIAKFRRTYAGAQLYMIFKGIIDKRAAEGKREDDALQYLIDQGDDVTKIITVRTTILSKVTPSY
jgi:sterol 14-demethylase